MCYMKKKESQKERKVFREKEELFIWKVLTVFWKRKIFKWNVSQFFNNLTQYIFLTIQRGNFFDKSRPKQFLDNSIQITFLTIQFFIILFSIFFRLRRGPDRPTLSLPPPPSPNVFKARQGLLVGVISLFNLLFNI